MRNYSTHELPKPPQRWKEGEWVLYFDHKTVEADKDIIYSADMTILLSLDKAEIERALTRHFIDPSLERKVIDNIEDEGQRAISIVMNYKKDAFLKEKIDTILASYSKK